MNIIYFKVTFFLIVNVFISSLALANPIQLFPNGTISDVTPTYSWQSISSATTYSIGMEDPATELGWRDYSVTASNAGCPGANQTCTYTPPETLSNGDNLIWYLKTDGGAWKGGMIFTVNSSSQVNRYVSTIGNNANDGSLSSPWRTINYAVNQLSGSTPTTLHIKAGVYKELVKISNIDNLSILGERTVSGENLTIIDGSDNFDPLNPPIHTDEETYHTGLFTAIDVNNFTIEGIKLRKSKRHGILIKGNAVNVNVLYCSTEDTRGSGILIEGKQPFDSTYRMSNVVVKYNKVDSPQQGVWDGNRIYQEDITLAGGIDGFEISENVVDSAGVNNNGASDGGPLAIDVKDGIKNGTIHNNTLLNIPSGGIYIDGGSQQGGVNTVDVYQNLIKHTLKAGIQISGEQGGAVNNVKVYNNIVSKAETGLACDNNAALDENGVPYSQAAKYVDFYHNTIYDSIQGMWIEETLCNVNVDNNVISETSSFDISFWGVLGALVNVNDNCFHGIGSSNVQGNTAVVDYSVSPFIDAEAGNFNLNSSTVCTGKGVQNGVAVGASWY